jgi:hypothetical protein
VVRKAHPRRKRWPREVEDTEVEIAIEELAAPEASD